jgi:hypothetical protein
VNAFIGILQVLIRDLGGNAGVARVHATRVSYHRFPIRRSLSYAIGINFTLQLFLEQLIKKCPAVNGRRRWPLC